jgi:protein-S-isoprenylcysteine O-methyltransferase Ste14
MAQRNLQTTVGQQLFSWRSLSPLPVIALALFLYSRQGGQPGAGGAGVDVALNVGGAVLACLGQALRFYTLGWVPEGTSGQNLTIQASTLNTQGPYAFVRNPLYVGNFAIVFGLLMVAHSTWIYLLGLVFFFGEYYFIIGAEEAFLRAKFGAQFDTFCAAVPRWIPRLTPAFEGSLRSGPFDWKRALKKEVNPFAAWVTGLVVLVFFERWQRGQHTVPSTVALGLVWVSSLLLLLGVKIWKKGWLA